MPKANDFDPLVHEFKVTLKEVNGKSITLDDIIKYYNDTGKPFSIEPEFIHEIAVYKDGQLFPLREKLHHIDIIPIIPPPMRIIVPGRIYIMT